VGLAHKVIYNPERGASARVILASENDDSNSDRSMPLRFILLKAYSPRRFLDHLERAHGDASAAHSGG